MYLNTKLKRGESITEPLLPQVKKLHIAPEKQKGTKIAYFTSIGNMILRWECITSHCIASIVVHPSSRAVNCKDVAVCCTSSVSTPTSSIYLGHFMDPIKHDLYMFVFFDRHVPVIYPFMKDFLCVTINNLYIITSRVRIQSFHYFLLQII